MDFNSEDVHGDSNNNNDFMPFPTTMHVSRMKIGEKPYLGMKFNSHEESYVITHGKSRATYLKFNDVIVFDVTYKTNKFSLPFSPFTGEWLNYMHGIEPGAIITDQDRAMCNAIHKVFPNTRHSYCYWHLQRHIADHLHTLNSVYSEEFQKYWDLWCNSGNIENYNLHWLEIKEKFKIIEEEDGWLQTMYMYRDHWVLCFLKGMFFAGMRSTQTSESINSFFDGYVNLQTQLKEFVTQYEKTVTHRRLSEAHEDFRTLNTKPQFHLRHPIERQVESSYTRTMFHVFQNEIKGCGVLGLQEEKKEEKSVLCRVGDLDESNEKWRFVTYDECKELQYSCNCAIKIHHLIDEAVFIAVAELQMQ
ncbi:protein FAR1-RELATED SEQUENCE 5-like [Asparagus officinalis]|uniref:protein FAR1-RELATED SEQUENCE 5-like n=1 Tax=Asparagus officinalis TaxID=4686 RepID=UPI00098E6A94|nr:protein FAR1-RELATED SEQUENCE 5-like [Asparagus officinalis]